MIINERYNLIYVISSDLLRYGKLPVTLLLTVLVSAILVVVMTHDTRQFTTKLENIGLETQALDIECMNLLIEHNALVDPNRIEALARKHLHMQHIDPLSEHIIIQS